MVGMPKIVYKFAYWALPKRVHMFSTLFTIDTQIIHDFTFRTHVLSTCVLVHTKKSHHAYQGLLCSPYQKTYKPCLISCKASVEKHYKNGLKFAS